MARSARLFLALATLVVGGTALQLAPEGNHACGRGFAEYEHLDEKHPHACLVYCVPEGFCAAKEAVGAMAELRFTGRGDCHERGFTEPAELGNLTNPIMERLQSFKGPCKGMKVLKFKKPHPTGKPASPKTPAGSPKGPRGPSSPENPTTLQPKKPVRSVKGKGPAAEPGTAEPAAKPKALCAQGNTPFKAVKEQSGQCTVYCVPDGDCLGLAEAGKLDYLSISGQGLCADDGYTLREEPADKVKYWISHLHGSCKGMTLHKFRQPPASEGEGPAAEPGAEEPRNEKMLGANTYAVYQKTARVLVLTPRDFMIVVHMHKHRDGSISIIAFSDESVESLVPASKGVVRGEAHIVGWYLQKIGDKETRVQLIQEIDLKGMVPKSLISQTNDMQAEQLKKLPAVVREYVNDPKMLLNRVYCI